MQPQPFDRDVTLGELLHAASVQKVKAALSKSLGTDWKIVDIDDTVLLAPEASTELGGALEITIPLRLDIESIGALAANHKSRDEVSAAALWLELILRSTHRYRMASDLHIEAVNADYAALQREHAAVQASEARYRELAAQLEQRVAAQVQVIERTQRQLYQSEKMASVGSLAAGMAHEINNPIGFIRSNLATATSYVPTLAEALMAFQRNDVSAANAIWKKTDIDFILEDFAGLLAESISGADRVARIVANLKAYASINCDTAVNTNLNDAVRTVTQVARDQIPAAIQLETDLQPLPNFVCDQSRINQALFSLIQNARLAISGNGTIRVSTRFIKNEICIAITDDGCGIAPDILNRIFDPFFTTRDVGKGMGLGLTVSRDIIMAHGGYIDVNSQVGQGSTFTLYLPIPINAPSPASSLSFP